MKFMLDAGINSEQRLNRLATILQDDSMLVSAVLPQLKAESHYDWLEIIHALRRRKVLA